MTGPWTRSPENAVGSEAAGALAAFFAGGAGPTHGEIHTAFALAGVPDLNSEGTKQTRVLMAVRSASDEAARAIVDELVGLLRTGGYLADATAQTDRLREALQREGATLTPGGFVDWPSDEASAAPPPKVPTPPPPADVPVVARIVEVHDPNLDMLESILRRLPQAVRPLLVRRRQRDPIAINDEYDIQDVAETALRLVYADVRQEEWNPSSAGSASRMDLLVKAERCAVETKVTRPGRGERAIKEELLVDINDFKGHPSVRTLVVAIYDLAGTFANGPGFEADLTRMHDSLAVRVLVVGWPVTARL